MVLTLYLMSCAEHVAAARLSSQFFKGCCPELCPQNNIHDCDLDMGMGTHEMSREQSPPFSTVAFDFFLQLLRYYLIYYKEISISK